MTIPILVEGDVDASTLKALTETFPYGFEVEFRSNNGKHGLTNAVASLITATRGIVGVAEDLDSGSPEDLRQHYRKSLQNRFNGISGQLENIFKVGDNFVFLIPLGLYKDEDLKSFNVPVHMIEDYLIKIILKDNNVIRKLSHSNYSDSNELKQTLQECYGSLADKSRSFKSSKELIEMSKALFHFSASPATFAEEIIINADPTVVKDVMSDIHSLFILMGEQEITL